MINEHSGQTYTGTSPAYELDNPSHEDTIKTTLIIYYYHTSQHSLDIRHDY